jgi:hypothetical protein
MEVRQPIGRDGLAPRDRALIAPVEARFLAEHRTVFGRHSLPDRRVHHAHQQRVGDFRGGEAVGRDGVQRLD